MDRLILILNSSNEGNLKFTPSNHCILDAVKSRLIDNISKPSEFTKEKNHWKLEIKGLNIFYVTKEFSISFSTFLVKSSEGASL